MPTYERDPLSNVADAFIKLLRTDTLLAAYNWQEWDSDVDAEMPRAYIAVTADAALVEAGGPVMANVEVVLMGKPRREKLSSVMGEIYGMITDPSLHRNLNKYTMAPPSGNAASNLVQFYRQAETYSVLQRIEGDIRVRRISFKIAALMLG